MVPKLNIYSIPSMYVLWIELGLRSVLVSFDSRFWLYFPFASRFKLTDNPLLGLENPPIPTFATLPTLHEYGQSS